MQRSRPMTARAVAGPAIVEHIVVILGGKIICYTVEAFITKMKSYCLLL